MNYGIMNWNKIIYTLWVVLATTFSAKAEETQRVIRIENFSTRITGDALDIHFDIKASGLDMKCNGQMLIEFAVENAERRLVLPVVVYSGNTRYHYERRRETLSGSFQIEPYAMYKGVKKNKVYETDYTLSIPYYTWMEHADITYREYTHDCSGDKLAGNGTLLTNLNPAPVEPEIWKPDSTLYPNLVSFLVPEVENVKARASMIELRIGFPVNITEVRPAFGNNTYELTRADSLVGMLQSNTLIDINGVNIRGYASPEGRYESNVRLAKGRSESFKQYLIGKYPSNPYIRNAYTSWVPEDWEGFGRIIENYDIPGKSDILAIVNDPEISPDLKERMLQNIRWWSENYRVILREIYPRLRRIELKVDYTVQKLSDSQARELLYTHPELLSLDEIYRVANYYEPGSRQYREVYEIAARQYPNDIIANNNAAAAHLREGNAEKALPYLEKTAGHEYSLINFGAYYYITAEPEKAVEYFNKAKQAGIEQAEHNLKLITDYEL